MDRWPFAGRSGELDRIAGMLREGRSVVIAGDAGVGKSRLSTQVLESPALRDFAVETVRATQAAAALPFGALAHLLPAVVPSEVSNPLRWAADAVLGAAMRGGPPRRPLILAVDDAHLLDSMSAALVHLLPRLPPDLAPVRPGQARILATVRTGEPAPDSVVELWKDGLATRVELESLSEEDSAAVLAGALEGDVDPTTASRLWRVTKGNVLLLREVVLASRATGALRAESGMWRLDGEPALAPRLVEVIDQRLGRLDAAETRVLELVVLGEPVGLAELESLCPPEAVEAVEARGLIQVAGDGRRQRVRLTHPLYGEVIRSRCPDLRARRRVRELAEAVEATGARRREDTLRLAVWWLDAGDAPGPAVLLAGCEAAWALHDLTLAARLGWAALRAGGGMSAAITLGIVLNYAERHDEAEAMWGAVTDEPADDRERAGYAIARGHNLYWGLDRHEPAMRMLTDAEASIRDPLWNQHVTAQRAAFLVFGARLGESLPVATGLLAASQGIMIDAQAHAVATLAHGHSGRTATALEHAHAALSSVDAWHSAVPNVLPASLIGAGLAHLFAGKPGEAEALAAGALRNGAEYEKWDLAATMLKALLAQSGRLSGRLAEGARHAAESAAHGSGAVAAIGSLAWGELAHTAALMGDLGRARQALREAERRRLSSTRILGFWADHAAVWLAAMEGDAGGALSLAAELAEGCRAVGALGHEMITLHDAVRLGAAARVVGRIEEIAPLHDGDLAPACAAHARAAASGDGAALDRAAETFDGLGLPLHAADAFAQASLAHGAAGRTAPARASSARAWALSRRCEAGVTPALGRLRAPALTPRELEIARLAASGLTSKEIAARLFASSRTIDNHLSAIYAKLGISGRGDLGGLV
ncbi:LuxR C-terminal-related transcriptional regulator [Planotetraspora sp. A-T 1434]|uniref:helix-turn-helix transcriptional regulator n=1 Tax=Planotetraspora sp. A-T 1434 TaxID=2979219 RepID=UPI0021C16BE5|nr:LuxR family transcriptional regulator [Planotetraspora sp. A-T 1434]MCT9935045.1 LuxR C-terminal-related transcriptional regulator [Planotetraspora sp. A-T 1434]